MNEISRLGFVEIAVPDLVDAREFYGDVMGLAVMAETPTSVFMKGWDEHDHHSVVITAGSQPGLVSFGLKVADQDALAAIEGRAENQGAEVKRLSRGERVGLGEAIGLETPSGHSVYLYYQPDQPGRSVTPPDVHPADTASVNAGRIDHVALTGDNPAEQIKFMVDVLGLHISEQLVNDDGDPVMAFMFGSNKCHDVVLGAGPHARYHHFAMAVDDSKDVAHAFEVLSATTCSIEVPPSQHGVGRQHTMYFRDPAGNRVETATPGAMGYADAPPITWKPAERAQALFAAGGPALPAEFVTPI